MTNHVNKWVVLRLGLFNLLQLRQLAILVFEQLLKVFISQDCQKVYNADLSPFIYRASYSAADLAHGLKCQTKAQHIHEALDIQRTFILGFQGDKDPEIAQLAIDSSKSHSRKTYGPKALAHFQAKTFRGTAKSFIIKSNGRLKITCVVHLMARPPPFVGQAILQVAASHKWPLTLGKAQDSRNRAFPLNFHFQMHAQTPSYIYISKVVKTSNQIRKKYCKEPQEEK